MILSEVSNQRPTGGGLHNSTERTLSAQNASIQLLKVGADEWDLFGAEAVA